VGLSTLERDALDVRLEIHVVLDYADTKLTPSSGRRPQGDGAPSNFIEALAARGRPHPRRSGHGRCGGAGRARSRPPARPSPPAPPGTPPPRRRIGISAAAIRSTLARPVAVTTSPVVFTTDHRGHDSGRDGCRLPLVRPARHQRRRLEPTSAAAPTTRPTSSPPAPRATSSAAAQEAGGAARSLARALGQAARSPRENRRPQQASQASRRRRPLARAYGIMDGELAPE
jgi:hypothetical protein